jgi:hypothetical protein
MVRPPKTRGDVTRAVQSDRRPVDMRDSTSFECAEHANESCVRSEYRVREDHPIRSSPIRSIHDQENASEIHQSENETRVELEDHECHTRAWSTSGTRVLLLA